MSRRLLWLCALILIASPASAQRGFFIEDSGSPIVKKNILNCQAPVQCSTSGTDNLVGIEANSIGTTHIGPSGVDTGELADSAVGNTQMDDDAIGLAELNACTTGVVEYTAGTPACIATPGGGGGVYSMESAKGNLSSGSCDDTETDLVWATPFITSADVAISGSEITINTTGTYKFTVTYRTINSNRTELFIRTYIDTGSGFVQDTDAIISNYVSRDSDQDTGGISLIYPFELTAADVVEFRGFGDTDGTCAGLDEGTIVIVERVE